MSRKLVFFDEIQAELHASDSLHVLSRGLGQHTALANFIASAVVPGSIILGLNITRPIAAAVLWPLLQSVASPTAAPLLLPRFLSADYSIRDRIEVYKSSGFILVTPAVLVHDLLHSALPTDRVAGLVIASAESIRERSNLHFALTLFRARNRTAFVKALSEAPTSLARGFHTAERQLRVLYLSRLVLWPRFHRSVRSALRPHAPDLLDLAVPTAPRQTALLAALGNVVHAVLHDVRSATRTLDLSEVFREREGRKSLAHNFDDLVRSQLEGSDDCAVIPTARVRGLLADLSVLRSLLRDTFELDAVALYQRIVTLRHTAPRAHSWLVRREAQSAVLHARSRVWTQSSTVVQRPCRDNEEGDASTHGGGEKIPTTVVTPTLEPSPKWRALREVLAEIRSDACVAGADADVCRVLVTVRSSRVVDELRAVLSVGERKYLEAQFQSVFPSVARRARSSDAGPVQTTLTQLALPEEDRIVPQPVPAQGHQEAWRERRDARREMRVRKRARKEVDNAASRAADGGNEAAAEMREVFKEIRATHQTEVEVLLWAAEWTDAQGRAQRLLEEYAPAFVVLYHADLALVRQVEVYKAARPGRPVRLYVLAYDDAAEEERFRLAAEYEKAAFRTLIRERATMTLHANQEGREVEVDFTQSLLSGDSAVGTSRRGLGADRDSRLVGPRPRVSNLCAEPELQKDKNVLVDTRELRSALPMLLHQTGITIVPLTLEVGDFVLSRDIGIERKSVPDLHGSFGSGRLFNQADALTRHYKHACLLIELEARRPMSLTAVSGGVPSELLATHIVSKMVLLIQQFPTLRLLWARGPHDAAELFAALKKNEGEPDAEVASGLGVDSKDVSEDRFNAGPKSLLRSLPGVDSHNLERVMRNVRNVATLVTMSKEELSEVLGSAAKAKKLYDFVNEQPSEALAAL